MPVRPFIRCLAWVIALAFLVPVAGLAGVCGDCAGGEVPGCCPPTCSLCLCCGKAPTRLDGADKIAPEPGRAPAFGEPANGGPLCADPRDVFHVPKPFLL
jgi:hypothetical protein